MRTNNYILIVCIIVLLFSLPSMSVAGWVAVGDRGMLLTSTDGINWTMGDSGFMYDPDAPLRNVSTDGSGNWIVAGGDGLILSSNDGEVWQPVTSGTSEVLWGSNFASGAGHPTDLWVVSGTGGYVLTSPDQSNWTTQNGEFAHTLFEVASNPQGMHMAVGGTSNGMALWSKDSITWHQKPPQTPESFKGVVYGKDKWVAVGDNGVIFTNPDPSAGNWTEQASGTGETLWAVTYDGSDLFVAVGTKGTILTSSDGLSWTTENVIGQEENDLEGVAYDGTMFVAVGESGKDILYSYDGHVWFTTHHPSGFQLKDVASGLLPNAPQVDIIKTADQTVVYHGDTVTFTITVSNTGGADLNVTSLMDDVFGDLNGQDTCSLQDLTPNTSYTCSFPGQINAPTPPGPYTHINVATVTATSAAGTVNASDSETIQIVVPIDGGGIIGQRVWYDKNADKVQDPDEPGIDGWTVNLSGDATATTTTANGGQYHFNVAAGTYSVEVVVPPNLVNKAVLTTDSNPTAITINNGDAAIGINFGYAIASIKNEKTVDRHVVDSSPSTVTYTVKVSNTSALPVTLNTLTDHTFGNLGTKGCALPAVIPPYGNYTCSFSETVTCADGDIHVNIVTAEASDQDGNLVVSSDFAFVLFDIFPWILFPPPGPCATFPLYCYMVADIDNQGSRDSRLFMYIFRGNTLEPVNYLGVDDVETMATSLDGKTIYAVNGGVLGTIDPSPGKNNSFTAINPSGLGSGNGAYGYVLFDDIDGLSFDPTDGTLYGTVRYRELTSGIMDLLIKINPSTGTAIRNGFGSGRDYIIIDTGAAGAKDTDDIAIDHEGIMYGAAGNTGGGGGDQGVIIDKNTGAVQIHAPLIDPAGKPIQDMEGFCRYNQKHFYGTTGIEFSDQFTDNSLYSIEKATGKTKLIIRLDQNFGGYVPSDFEAVTCFPICP